MLQHGVLMEAFVSLIFLTIVAHIVSSSMCTVLSRIGVHMDLRVLVVIIGFSAVLFGIANSKSLPLIECKILSLHSSLINLIIRHIPKTYRTTFRIHLQIIRLLYHGILIVHISRINLKVGLLAHT